MKEWIHNRKQGIVLIIIATIIVIVYLALKDRPGKPVPAKSIDSLIKK